MRTSAAIDRTRWRGVRGVFALVTVGLVSAAAGAANATPPGKGAAAQESVSFDAMHGNRPMQTTQTASSMRPTPARTTATTNANRNATGRTNVRPPPNARGGGPRQTPPAQCAHGQPCVAPDLSPGAPQNQWDRDPRVPQMRDINDRGPGPQAMGTER